MPQVRFRIVREKEPVFGATVEFFQDGVPTAIASVTTDAQGLSWSDLDPAEYRVYVTIDTETLFVGRYKVKSVLPIHLSGNEVVDSTFPMRFQSMRYMNKNSIVNTSQYAEWSV